MNYPLSYSSHKACLINKNNDSPNIHITDLPEYLFIDKYSFRLFCATYHLRNAAHFKAIFKHENKLFDLKKDYIENEISDHRVTSFFYLLI